MKVRQGEVWFTDLGEPVGTEQGSARPTLIISNDGFNRMSRDLVVVVPLTSRDRGWDTHIPIPLGETRLRRPSWAMVQQIRSVSIDRFKFPMGHVAEETVDRIVTLLGRLL
ncbi:mRNA interferase [Acrocarpospora phusangensis]|uniref:mRNA interferase n=1 Tax=Acrocarpospora phusangensis TaxID=1070424 RepID=A0A919QFD0_9ACTN|nr:type II toxin-antitoxin system PemK/MazF family toxin [Acrocarpospora phusangensis]GIH26886.1 mRNA interferase [Acrocarpospora phusangensis]